MPLSIFITLEAAADATLDTFTGQGVHGFWFGHWKKVDAAIADELHSNRAVPPFTLSPVLSLPRPERGGKIAIPQGHRAGLHIALLSEGLCEAARAKWLPGLEMGSMLEIPDGIGWKVIEAATEEHSYQEMARSHLMNSNPPRQWELEFLTPTTFHGANSHLPFPLPESLIGSWLRRWQAFAPVALLEEEMTKWARSNLAVSAYRLHTLPAREGERLRVGCVGRLSLRAIEMPPYLRAAVDLLVTYSGFCGSGAHTTQGLGQTRCRGRR